MAAYGQPPDPLEELRRTAPRTGPPGVANMRSAAPKTITSPVRPPATPSVAAGPPGPQGAPTPVVPPSHSAPRQAGAPVLPSPTASPVPVAPPTGQGTPYDLVGFSQAPTARDLRALGTGKGLSTARGDVYRGQDGKLQVRLNDVGKAQRQAEQAQKLARFGNYPGRGEPDDEPPPVGPGPIFSPFDKLGWR